MKNWRQTFTSLVMNTTPDEKFDPKELQVGIESAQEHGVTPAEAKSMAKDDLHTTPDYYTKLKQYVETKSSSKLSQRGRQINSMGESLYLRCPTCTYESREEEFKKDPYGDSFVICPQCKRPFDPVEGDPFSSGEEF